MSSTSSSAELSGGRRAAYQILRGLLALFAAGSIVQFFLAGAGAFGAKDKGFEAAKSFGPHAAVGSLLTVVVLVALIAVAIARPGRDLVRGTALLFVLMIAQNLLGATGANARWILGALHPVNGVLITATAFYLAAVAFGRLPRRAPTAVTEPQPGAAAYPQTADTSGRQAPR